MELSTLQLNKLQVAGGLYVNLDISKNEAANGATIAYQLRNVSMESLHTIVNKFAFVMLPPTHPILCVQFSDGSALCSGPAACVCVEYKRLEQVNFESLAYIGVVAELQGIDETDWHVCASLLRHSGNATHKQVG